MTAEEDQAPPVDAAKLASETPINVGEATAPEITDEAVIPEEPNDEKPLNDSAAKPVKSIRSSTEEFVVKLPGGFWSDGALHKRITLQTMSAGDRLMFGDEKLLSNPGKLTTKMLMAKISAVDGLSSLDERTVRQAQSFDRDFLVFQIRKRTTRNRDFQQTFKCDHCGAANDVEVPIEEVEESLTLMPEAMASKREKNGELHYSVELPEYGFKGTFRRPNGMTEEKLAGIIDPENMNAFEIDLEFMKELCIDFNSEGELQNTDNLEIEFVDDVQMELQKQQYGYSLSPKQTCYKCKKKSPVRMEVLDFLYEGIRQRRGGKPPSKKK